MNIEHLQNIESLIALTKKHMSRKLKFHYLIKPFNNMETLWVFLVVRERESHLFNFCVVRFRVYVCASPIVVSDFSFSTPDSGYGGNISSLRSLVWLHSADLTL